jgi:hypothetical protein
MCSANISGRMQIQLINAGSSFSKAKSSRIFAKNSVKRSLSLNSSPSAWSVNVNWSLNCSTTSTKLPCLQAAKAVCRIRSEVVASAEALSKTALCVFITIYSFFCRLAVSFNCQGFVYNL